MADRGFSVARLPGFTATAVFAFVALYLPILMLVAYSFNAGKSVGIWEGGRCNGMSRRGAMNRSRRSRARR